MADILELEVSYPDFVLGSIIDPDEFDQNNTDIVNKINEVVADVNSNTNSLSLIQEVADEANENSENAVADAETAVADAATAVSTANDALLLAGQASVVSTGALDVALNSSEIVAAAVVNVAAGVAAAEQAVILATTSTGNTQIFFDVFTIVHADNGDGSFTYNDGTYDIAGVLTVDGYQRFSLSSNYYVGSNRIEATINDTLTRSQASGGLIEVGDDDTTSSTIDLVTPVGDGTEVTFKYFNQISLGGLHAQMHNVGSLDEFIHVSETEPETTYAGQFFYQEV